MKKLFLLLSLFCVTNSVKAQEKIIQEDKEWAIIQGDTYMPSDTAHTYILFFQGDTTIDNTSYKKLYSSQKEDKSNASVIGFLRTEAEKIYARQYRQWSDNISQEGLLYDFSLEIGDTITIKNVFFDNPPVTLVLDTIIENMNGKGLIGYCFKEFDFPTYFWVDIWYLGVGSRCGLINVTGDLFFGGPRPALLCCHDSTEKLLYQNPEYNTCYYYLGIDDLSKNKQLQINISPNPVADYIRVEIDDIKQEKYTFKLYNSQGNLVLQKEIATKITKIPVKELPQGAYFYAVSNKEQTAFERGKIVKVK